MKCSRDLQIIHTTAHALCCNVLDITRAGQLAHGTCMGLPLRMRVRLPWPIFLPAALLLGPGPAVQRSQSELGVSPDALRSLPRKPAMTAANMRSRTFRTSPPAVHPEGEPHTFHTLIELHLGAARAL